MLRWTPHPAARALFYITSAVRIAPPVVYRVKASACSGKPTQRWRRDRMSGPSLLAMQTAYFDQFLEQVPEGVVLLDAEDRVVRINAEFTRLFGYASNEATGQSLHDLVRPEALDSPASPTTVPTHPAQGRISFDAVYRARRGNLIHVSVLGAPVDLASADVKALVIYRDITDRVRAERARQHADEARGAEARRKSEVFFSEGQRLSHTGSWAYIVATDELMWSEEHCRLLGYDPSTKPSLDL